MSTATLTSAARSALKARAHSISPVVIIGNDGLTSNVMAEIDRALAAHELIKIRVSGDDRRQRLTLLEEICSATKAAPVQQIGKLLILFRPAPRPVKKDPPPASTGAARKAAKRNPISGRAVLARPGKSASKEPARHPPRTARVRKSGQKSSKKAFQSQ